MTTGEKLRERFLNSVRAVIDAPDPAAGPKLDDLRDASQALLDSHAWIESSLEAHNVRIEAYRAVLTHLAFPVLQVRHDTLCVPVFGELDAERTARLAEAVVAIAVARGVTNVVLDLTGAQLTRETPLHLGRVFQILEQLAVQGALSGVGPEAAEALAGHPDALPGVRCFTELASALAALRPRSPARAWT